MFCEFVVISDCSVARRGVFTWTCASTLASVPAFASALPSALSAVVCAAAAASRAVWSVPSTDVEGVDGFRGVSATLDAGAATPLFRAIARRSRTRSLDVATYSAADTNVRFNPATVSPVVFMSLPVGVNPAAVAFSRMFAAKPNTSPAGFSADCSVHPASAASSLMFCPSNNAIRRAKSSSIPSSTSVGTSLGLPENPANWKAFSISPSVSCGISSPVLSRV